MELVRFSVNLVPESLTQPTKRLLSDNSGRIFKDRAVFPLDGEIAILAEFGAKPPVSATT